MKSIARRGNPADVFKPPLISVLEKIIIMFYDSTIKLLDAYQSRLGGTPPSSYNGDLLAEVRERLKMLSILYDKVCDYQNIAMSFSINMLKPVAEFFEYTKEKQFIFKRMPTKEEFAKLQELSKQHNELIIEMKMYAESFYYFAARIRKIIKDKKEPLPYLKSFESKAIRDVRNRLIEHPENLIPACGFGGEEGLKLKGAYYPNKEKLVKDQGFCKNALEFKENLEKVLNAALKDKTKK